MYVRTGLVAEQQLALLRAGVYAGHGGATFPVAPVVGEGERTPEGALDCHCVLSEHGVEQGVPRYQTA